jgi:hypothetical protein
MRRPWWLGILLIGLIAAVPALCAVGNDPRANALLLLAWRDNQPKHYDRLKEDFRAFQNMEPDQQKKIRKFDTELHAQDKERQERLWGVLERYRAWVEGLRPDKREQLLAAGKEKRLELLATWRREERIARLPRQLAGTIGNLQPDKQAAEWENLRNEGRDLRTLWIQGGARKGRYKGTPAKLSEFPDDVQQYVRDVLGPRLSRNEKDYLQQKEGNWPAYAKAIYDTQHKKHPRLPPLHSGPVRNKADLLNLMKTASGEMWGRLQQNVNVFVLNVPPEVNGYWPEYALHVSPKIKQNIRDLTLPPLGASTLEQFPDEMKKFITTELIPVLNNAERESLKKLDGKWPEYPNRLLRLAEQHDKVIPGMSIPGPPELWKAARLGLPGGG